ncbi:alpha/beta hydrolase [Rhodococcus sp. NPDC003318]|uniref:alpha/beta hydrolase n=1 Tax=Rhodococcus sp. NPDC003318 TaxID=3364503 RepID=UPI003695D677
MRVMAALAAAVATVFAAPAAVAGELPARGASVDHVTMLTDRRAAVFVDSPAMGRIVQVQVLLPADRDTAHPTLYLLDGVGGGQESGGRESDWTTETDAADFFADKPVNVVLPVGGAGSYYTDWQRADPVLGVNRWETFLADELPPLIDTEFGGNGVNTVAGLSMGGAAALNLITRRPELYTGVASYSGCADTSSPEARFVVRRAVGLVNGDADNMWGLDDDPDWAAHDPLHNAAALRGKVVYSSVGNGALGPRDRLDDPALPLVAALGGPLEAAALHCTLGFERRLQELGIPATFDYRPAGTHTWLYWQDALRSSWPSLSRAMGV